jgi:predicted DNA-binding transcriptional regulator YafY
MDDIIATAIRERQILSFRYGRTERRVEPHLLGYTRDGVLALRAWLLGCEEPAWRLFPVSGIRELRVEGETFAHVRPGHSTGDIRFARIVAAA